MRRIWIAGGKAYGSIAAHRPLLATVLRFASATLFSASLSFVLPLLLHEVGGLGERTSVAISFSLAYVLNFVLLRKHVFVSRSGWRRDIALYAVVNALFRIAEFLLFTALRSSALLSYAAALLVVLGFSTIVKFFAYRRLFGRAG